MQHLNRRWFTISLSSFMLVAGSQGALAQRRRVWSATEAFDALSADRARIIDVRTRDEWNETGVGSGIWPISMHEDRFTDRLFAANALAGDREIGLICATGGRSAYLQRALFQAGYDGYFDVSEGMLGSRSGPGWMATGLPVVAVETALAALPATLS